MGLMSKISKGFADAVSPIGGLLNGITGVSEQTDRTYYQQQKAMDSQNDYNTYMWNLANQYNTPQAQLARMADAGIDINPTSYALGTGNLSNTAGVVTSASGFSGSGSPAGNPITMAMGVANGIQGIRESKARTALDEANTDNMVSTRKNTEERTRQLRNENAFFEKHGYYPAHGDTPVLSGYEHGLVPEILKNMGNPKSYDSVTSPFSAVARGWNETKKAWKRVFK